MLSLSLSLCVIVYTVKVTILTHIGQCFVITVTIRGLIAKLGSELLY